MVSQNSVAELMKSGELLGPRGEEAAWLGVGKAWFVGYGPRRRWHRSPCSGWPGRGGRVGWLGWREEGRRLVRRAGVGGRGRPGRGHGGTRALGARWRVVRGIRGGVSALGSVRWLGIP